MGRHSASLPAESDLQVKMAMHPMGQVVVNWKKMDREEEEKRERERIEREAEERKLELQKKEEEEHIVEIRKTEEDDVVIKVPVEVCNKALDMKNFQLALDKAKEGDEDVKIKWANKKKNGF